MLQVSLRLGTRQPRGQGWLSVVTLVIAQYLGAFTAALLAFLLYWDGIIWLVGWQLGPALVWPCRFEHQIGEYRPVPQTASIFATYPAPYLSVLGALMDQVLASAALLLGVSAILDTRNKVALMARPVYYGLVVLGLGLCLGSNTGVGFNPAR